MRMVLTAMLLAAGIGLIGTSPGFAAPARALNLSGLSDVQPVWHRHWHRPRRICTTRCHWRRGKRVCVQVC
jgi:hypothetical protein